MKLATVLCRLMAPPFIASRMAKLCLHCSTSSAYRETSFGPADIIPSSYVLSDGHSDILRDLLRKSDVLAPDARIGKQDAPVKTG